MPRRNFQTPVTRENISDEDIKLLNLLRLGLLPNWEPLTRPDGTSESEQQNFNRDILTARESSAKLHGMLFGNEPFQWTIEDYAASQRSFEKFMEFTMTWKKHMESLRASVSPNSVRDGAREVPIQRVGKVLTKTTKNEDIKKPGRPRMSKEERFAMEHLSRGFSADFVRTSLQMWPNLTPELIDSAIKQGQKFASK